LSRDLDSAIWESSLSARSLGTTGRAAYPTSSGRGTFRSCSAASDTRQYPANQ
jgi:hypothetical protein